MNFAGEATPASDGLLSVKQTRLIVRDFHQVARVPGGMHMKHTRHQGMKVRALLFLMNFAAGFLISQAGLRADALDHWNLRNRLATGNRFHGVAFGNGACVAVGTGTNDATSPGVILTSTDGVEWIEATNLSATAIIYGAGRFVAVGPGPSLVSTNGREWTAGTATVPGNLAYGNGLFLAAGFFGVNPPVLTSVDGLNWTNQTVSFDRLTMIETVAYGNGIFLMIVLPFGGGYYALTSIDGTTWTRPAGQNEVPTCIAFANGLFVGVQQKHVLVTSSNGFAWTPRETNVAALNGVGFANGIFGAVGDGGFMLTSPDGSVWASRTTSTSSALYAFAGNDNSFVAVGDAGTILQSDDTRPRLSARITVGGGVELSAAGGLRRIYRAQASDRLPASEWLDLLTFTNTAPSTNFVDTSATNFSLRFYRVVSP
jgi:hypothetical protein